MKTLIVATAAIGMLGALAPAQAFHPSDETYGYVAPQKLRKSRAAEPTLWWSPPPTNSWGASSDVLAAPKNKFKKGPETMDGGGKPYIGAATPPTVSFPNNYGAGTIVIDTAGRSLYYVLSSSRAYRYPIAVGKAGFAWTGTQKISRKVAWPDWRPPAEMLARKPYLPQFMTGGIRNPLGAMALYLGGSLYRIHGTNDVKSIGTAASSGCIRMTNGHVMHLSKIAGVGTTVKVLHKLPAKIATSANAW